MDGVAPAVFVNAPEEILEFGPLFGSEDLADLVVALFANLSKFWIHLVVDDVVAVLHIRQYLPDLFLLVGRKVELGGQVGDRSRRIWPWLQKARRLRLSLSAGAEDAPIGDGMSADEEDLDIRSMTRPSPSSAEAGRALRAGQAALHKAANPGCLFRHAD